MWNKRYGLIQLGRSVWVDWRYHAARKELELEWTQKLVDDIESGRLE